MRVSVAGEDKDGRVERPYRAAGAHAGTGFGTSPEEQAWRTLLDWAKAGGLLDGEPVPRFFGFNNPSPSAGSLNTAEYEMRRQEPTNSDVMSTFMGCAVFQM
jgi:hypothetical protein